MQWIDCQGGGDLTVPSTTPGGESIKMSVIGPCPSEIYLEELFPEFEASGSEKGKVGEKEEAPSMVDHRFKRDTTTKTGVANFYSKNPDAWLFRAERYFNINKLTLELRADFFPTAQDNFVVSMVGILGSCGNLT